MARHANFPKPLTAVQERIHTAALRLFAEKGMHDVNVRELALRARVARGTIYNNGQNSMRDVFTEIVGRLSAEMFERVGRTLSGIEDPVQRLSNGMRLFVRRGYEEQDWGAFIVRFAMNDDTQRQMWHGHPRRDILNGISTGRYKLRPEQVPSAVTMVAGNTVGAIFLALHGHRSWRAAGSDAVELTLRAFGVPPQAARTAASTDLPPLLTTD